ncbi:hypothetical protein INR49_004787, partial [Caranx melampygus]
MGEVHRRLKITGVSENLVQSHRGESEVFVKTPLKRRMKMKQEELCDCVQSTTAKQQQLPCASTQSCCRPSSHKNFSACFKQHSTMLTGNDGVCRVLVLLLRERRRPCGDVVEQQRWWKRGEGGGGTWGRWGSDGGRVAMWWSSSAGGREEKEEGGRGDDG